MIYFDASCRSLRRWFLILLSCLGILPASSQKTRDTVATTVLPSADSLLPGLVVKVASYTSTIDHTDFLVRRKYNVTPIALDLPEMEKRLAGFKSRLAKRGGQMNLRGLNSGVIMLKETAKDLSNYQNILTRYSAELTKSNREVKKILTDPVLQVQVPDSILQEQLRDIRVDGHTLDSLEQVTLSKVNLLRNRVSVDYLQATDVISDMQYLSLALKMGMWGQEESSLFVASPAEYRRGLGEDMTNALVRSTKIIGIYLEENLEIVTLALLVLVLLFIWINMNMRRVRRLPNEATVLEPVYFLRRRVLISCLFAFFTYLPFFFANPPMSFLHACEACRVVLLAFLLYPFLTKPAKLTGLLLLLLWFVYALDDILLESAYGERWLLFVAGLILTYVLIKIIVQNKQHFKRLAESPVTNTLAVICLVQVLLSIVFNLTGRVSLAKITGVSAVQCLVLGVSLKVFCTMVLESVYLQSEAVQQSRFADFINYKVLQYQFQRWLWVLASVVWTVSLVRNLTLYDLMLQSLGTFFNGTRTIGNMVFTFKNVAVFICIIWLSSLISGAINFFFGNEKVKTGKRSKLGSMMLLVRLAIWTLGFFIAVAAAGIPIDKLSLMLGALGVGIGFGLQNIVNNLVSGVILAFERPIQVGDLIEVGGKLGVVKEIGVRSSKINNNEGADIIVPNGDLLSQHLINWTMQDRNKQLEFTIGIPYDADINRLRTVIRENLAQQPKVMKVPAPGVAVMDFGALAISLKITFWVDDLTEAGSIRSSAMLEIFNLLAAEGVHLPIANPNLQPGGIAKEIE